MDDNNKELSEFEKLAKEATGEIPTVNNNATIEEKKDDSSIQIDDIQIVDDDGSVELPQQKQSDVTASVPQNVIENANINNVQTIGTVKPDKQKSPIAMLLLFVILVLFILFMPTAVSLFNKYFGTNFETNPGDSKLEAPIVEPEPAQKVTMYPLSESTVIAIDKVELNNFKKDNTSGYKLSFIIKNTGATEYEFDKKLYLDYYNESNTFIGRTYLETVKKVGAGTSSDFVVNINSTIFNDATKVEAILRTNDDYPNITLTDKQLTCTNEKENIVYTFDDNSRLLYIKDMFTYVKNDNAMDYSNDLLTYKSKISSLDALNGVTAILTETDNGFITSIAIDYSAADYSQLSSNTNYYVKDTYARIISFEMNAKGYNCK